MLLLDCANECVEKWTPNPVRSRIYKSCAKDAIFSTSSRGLPARLKHPPVINYLQAGYVKYLYLLTMAKWEDLSIEVRDKILFWFCKSTVDEFIDPIDPWDSKYNKDIEWRSIPPPPSPLRNYASAIKTSRHFYITITKRFRHSDWRISLDNPVSSSFIKR